MLVIVFFIAHTPTKEGHEACNARNHASYRRLGSHHHDQHPTSGNWDDTNLERNKKANKIESRQEHIEHEAHHERTLRAFMSINIALLASHVNMNTPQRLP